MSVQALTWVLECSESTLGDRLVLYSIANHSDHEGRDAYPSVASIAKESRLSERQVQRCLQNLQTLGELEVHYGLGPKGTNYFLLSKMTRPRCWYCGNDLFVERTVDHQDPVSRGGTNDLKNLVYACLPCNARKNNRTLDEYRAFLNGVYFYGESDEGRQYVTRPKRYTPTYRRPRVTNEPEKVLQMSPEPSFEPTSKPNPPVVPPEGGRNQSPPESFLEWHGQWIAVQMGNRHRLFTGREQEAIQTLRAEDLVAKIRTKGFYARLVPQEEVDSWPEKVTA